MTDRHRPIPLTQINAAATDLLVGIAAGVVAALAMSLFQSAVTKVRSQKEDTTTPASKAADAVSKGVSGAPVKHHLKKTADTALHYLTGAVAGGLYGLIGCKIPALFAGRGLTYGATLWSVADEALVPALGLAPPPTRTAPGDHAFGLASHLVFGLALDFCRRQINLRVSASPNEA